LWQQIHQEVAKMSGYRSISERIERIALIGFRQQN